VTCSLRSPQQLWLARDIVTDNPLPWQKQQPVKSRTGGPGNGRSFSGDWRLLRPNPVEESQDGLQEETACVKFAINSQKVLLNQLNNFQKSANL